MPGAPSPVPPPDLIEPAHAGAAAYALGALRGGNLTLTRPRPMRLSSLSTGRPARILVVEPDARCRSLLHLGLGREGFEVLAVGSAENAVRELALGRGPPAMVIIEADLPGEDGFALCGQLRADHRTAELPIIMMSRGPDGLHRDLASGSGADDFLFKPLFVNDVVALAKLKAGKSNVDPRYLAETESLPLAAILRGLLAGMRAGRIELLDHSGELAFRRGRVHSARFGPLDGEAALTRMLLLAEGAYTVTFGLALGEGPMHYGLRDLCTTVLPQIHRWQQLMPLSVPLDAQLTLDFARVASVHAELPREVERVMGLADGRRSVRDIVVDSPLPALTTLQTLTRLYAMAVLVPVPGTLVAERMLEASPVPDLYTLPRVPISEHWFDDADASLPAGLPEAPPPEALAPEPLTPSIRSPLAFESRQEEQVPAGAAAPFARGFGKSVEESFFDDGERAPSASESDDEVTEPALPTAPVRGFLSSPGRRLQAGALVVLALSVVAAVIVPRASAARVKQGLAPVKRLEMPAEIIASAPDVDTVPERPDETTTAQLSRASALYDAGRPAEAARILEGLTQDHPKVAEAWLVLGLARFDLRDARGAEAAAQTALHLDAREPRSQLLLASVYQELRDPTRERTALEKYLALAPKGAFADEAHQLLASLPAVAATASDP